MMHEITKDGCLLVDRHQRLADALPQAAFAFDLHDRGMREERTDTGIYPALAYLAAAEGEPCLHRSAYRRMHGAADQ